MGKAVKGAPSSSRSWRGTRPFPSFCRNALRKQSLKGFYSGASGQRRALAISLAEQETREVYPALLGASGQRGFEQPAVIKGNQTIFVPLVETLRKKITERLWFVGVRSTGLQRRGKNKGFFISRAFWGQAHAVKSCLRPGGQQENPTNFPLFFFQTHWKVLNNAPSTDLFAKARETRGFPTSFHGRVVLGVPDIKEHRTICRPFIETQCGQQWLKGAFGRLAGLQKRR